MPLLHATSDELSDIVARFSIAFASFSDSELSKKSSPMKWSKKEVIGHLIDSAQNNLRRFITGQYEQTPPHIVYNQEFWVLANDYNRMDAVDIIALWRLINLRIATVLKRMPEEVYGRLCNTGKSEPSLHPIQWIAQDYIPHMKHHINQIIPDAFPGEKYPS